MSDPARPFKTNPASVDYQRTFVVSWWPDFAGKSASCVTIGENNLKAATTMALSYGYNVGIRFDPP
jgi:hypothetical protein